jgi:uncharacterized iron-regulated membrane protein
MKRILLKIHLWLAFPAGLLVTVLCLSGAALVFRTEIEESLHPARYFTGNRDGDGQPLPLAQLLPLVEGRLANDTVSGVTVPSDPARAYMISLASNPRRPLYVNPCDGRMLYRAEGDTFFGQVLRLHRWLLLPPATGRKITGYVTLAFVLILLCGKILTFPTSRKSLRRRRPVVHLKRGWKRFCYDLHLSGGVWVATALLILSLTALNWSFRWYSRGFYQLFGAEAPLPPQHGRPAAAAAQPATQPDRDARPQRSHRDTTDRDARPQRGRRDTTARHGGGRPERGNRMAAAPQRPDFTHWDTLLDRIKRDNPHFRTVSIRSGTVSVAQRRRFGNSRATDSYTFNPSTGEITAHTPYASQPRASKVRGWIYSVHTGTWGGIYSKILTCLVSLVGASLPLTGYYIFCKKRRRRRVEN